MTARRNRIVRCRGLAGLTILLAMTSAWAAEFPGVAVTSSDLAAIAARGQAVIDAAKTNPLDFQRNAKVTMYEILASTAKVGCGDPQWRAYVVSLPSVNLTPGADIETMQIFSLPPLARYLHQFGHCLTTTEKAAILEGLTRVKRGLFFHGTLNHAIVQMASWYLFAQYFPKATWTDVDGTRYSSTALMGKLKGLLTRRTGNFYTYGHFEMLSPTYAMPNIFPLTNLYDFATDPLVKQNAAAELMLNVGVLRAHSFNGVTVSPLTRYIADQQNAPRQPQDYKIASSQQVLWFYYGAPRLSTYDLRAFEPYYITMLALSSWRPPLADKSTVAVSGDSYFAKVAIARSNVIDSPTATEILGDSLFAERFAIGAANGSFLPTAYFGAKQLFSIVYETTNPLNEIVCTHSYWSSNDGPDTWIDRWSPFMQTYRYDRSSVVMLISIPNEDPWQYPGNTYFAKRSARASDLDRTVQCRVPSSAEKIETSSDGMFIKNDDVYIAIRALNATPSFSAGAPPEATRDYHVIKINASNAALFFRVERDTQGSGFEAFKQSVMQRSPVYVTASSSVQLVEAGGINTTLQFGLARERDGWMASYPRVRQDPAQSPVGTAAIFDSPLLRLGGGTLTVFAGEQRFIFTATPLGRKPNPPKDLKAM